MTRGGMPVPLHICVLKFSLAHFPLLSDPLFLNFLSSLDCVGEEFDDLSIICSNPVAHSSRVLQRLLRQFTNDIIIYTPILRQSRQGVYSPLDLL
jgi:hypothetical protein